MIIKALRSSARLGLHLALLGLIVIVLSSLHPRSAYGATITVTKTDDEVANNGECSLREAIIAANMNSNAHEAGCTAGEPDNTDTIVLAEGTYYSLTLDGSSEDAALTGDLDIVDNDADVDLIISVAGTNISVISQDATPDDRVLHIQGATVEISNISITGGGGTTTLGGGVLASSGADVTLRDGSTVNLNAGQVGGGIYNFMSSVTINASAVADNTSEFNGGGIYVDELGGSVYVENLSSIIDNTAGGNGGGVFLLNSDSYLTVDESTFYGNGASNGGAIYNSGGNIDLNSSSIGTTLDFANTADFNGGGIANTQGGYLTLDFSFVAGNTANLGAGIYNENSTVEIENFSGIGALGSENVAVLNGGGIYNLAGSVTLTDSTVSDGEAVSGGGIFNESDGTTGGTVTLEGSSVEYNTTSGDGAGIYNSAESGVGSTLSLDLDSIVISNCSSGNGSGIYNEDDAEVDIASTGIMDNCALGSGGGIFNAGTMDIGELSGVTLNGAGAGGGIFNASTGALTLTDVTVAGNDADSGGGIQNFGNMTLTDSYVLANTADIAAGLSLAPDSTTSISGSMISFNAADIMIAGISAGDDATLTIDDTILSSNISAGDGGALYVSEQTLSVAITNSVLGANEAINGSAIYSNAETANAVSITTSCIIANTDIALWNNAPASQTATNNWWGDASGPNPSGFGDSYAGNWDVSGFMTAFPDLPGNGCAMLLLTIEGQGTGDGSIDNLDYGVDCDYIDGVTSGDCHVWALPMWLLEFEAIPAAGSTFVDWYQCDDVVDNLCSIEMFFDQTIYAEFSDGSPESPEITSADFTFFEVGTAGTFTVTADGIPAPTFSITETLPSGLSFDGTTGEISGTPDDGTGGEYTLTITATNGVAPDDVQSFTLYIDEAPEITSDDFTTFEVGVAGSFFVTTTGYPEPCFCMTGTLPSGVSFDSLTGELYGTPDVGTGGEYTLEFTVSNGIDPDAVQTFTLYVNEAPQITSADTVIFYVGMPNTFTFTTTGYPQPCFCFSGTLPAGVTFNTVTGLLSGTPAAGTEGTYTLSVTASNGVLPDATQEFDLVVLQPVLAVEPLGNGSCAKLASTVNLKIRGMIAGRQYTTTLEVRDGTTAYMLRQTTSTFAGPTGSQINLKWVIFPYNNVPALAAPQTYNAAWTTLSPSVTLRVTVVDRTTGLQSQTTMTYTCANGVVVSSPPVLTPNAIGTIYAP